MKTNFFTILIAFLITTNVFSQTNLNEYKYIIVPNKFDFLKQENQYQLNALTEFLFNKYGFNALMEGEAYPEDLVRNRCLALKSDVDKDSGMFKTKLKVTLKDCNDQQVFTSQMGESREKQYDKAYNEALREAFKSFSVLNYVYEPSSEKMVTEETSDKVVNTEVAQEIQMLKKEIKALKEDKKPEPRITKVPSVESKKTQVKTVTNTPKSKEIKEVLSNVLYAQVIEHGFQLVDSSPKVVYLIQETSLDNVFLVENKNAIIYRKGDGWIFEFYSNGNLQREELNIKF
ncbi:hypothetical protein [Changchengzhania lutea]|uniref:hypothetical protein n=1 Tax=Changchengzhania lutea TaxID=2049305 RepID=UPI00115EAA1E|nr:hypothetical protein [Changchengzhania lutea]